MLTVSPEAKRGKEIKTDHNKCHIQQHLKGLGTYNISNYSEVG